MMEPKNNVFSSNIIRSNKESKNNFYDLLNIVPVQPFAEKIEENTINDNCDFLPKSDKFYVPKKKSSQKVHTVRDIRNTFEKYVYSYLPTELEKQKNFLLRKIRYGFSKDKKTKELAIVMLKNDTPMSKSAWQMLMNINPEEQKFSSQYIHWKGKCIQVNGSKGGQHKFICNYDVGRIKQPQKKCATKSSILTRKRQLLHNSLNVKFKPGPLSKKKYLDDSYQKYQFGEIEVVGLPKIGLEVQTSYGKPLAPVIDTFINKSFLQNNGLITQNWAKFAVSVLGKNENGIVSKIDNSENSCVSFDLNYKCFQNKVLMRHDSDIVNEHLYNQTTTTYTSQGDSILISEIRSVMDNVLDTVEISLKQNEMYTGEDEPREVTTYNSLNTTTHSNNKTKRNGELHRLDVTVITISKTTESDKTVMCQNDFCTLGCICESLKCSYNLKRHCGLVECMFKCKCDFSKYKYMNSLTNDDCSDIIPGLINLDKTLGLTLAKEEHKFHQTVIVAGNRSILLKSNRRIWKASKKYAEFYSNMHLKTDHISTEMLSIVCPNLDCKNIEPWCMVHNLYKCFCKGKFTETGWIEETKIMENDNDISKSLTINTDININSNNTITKLELTNEVSRTNARSRRVRQILQSDNYTKKIHVSKESYSFTDVSYSSICARVQPYVGRKYKDEYYQNTNQKIQEMEKHDKTLYNKMLSLSSNDNDFDQDIEELNVENSMSPRLDDVLISKVENSTDNNEKEYVERLPAKTKLVSWLGESYKEYKQLVDRGLFKACLGPPKLGKLCLYSWEFILRRYLEGKNYFMVSKQSPFRLFVAVDVSNKFYDNCTNISDIILTDIDKYPVTVKNLLTNAKDLKESFCILYGLAHCWEIVGSVTKVIEIREANTNQEENNIDHLINTQALLQEQDNMDSLISAQELLQEKNSADHFIYTHDIIQKENNMDSEINPQGLTQKENKTDTLTHLQETFSETNTSHDNLEDLPIIINNRNSDVKQVSSSKVPKPYVSLSETPISKWFVMKVENDFSEIQFFKKGFFVKYENVIKAINVARLSGKTVKLSSQKYCNNQCDPQFGIYAIPSNKDCCVFIGPYEKFESLGIEAIKKLQSMETVIPEFRTRGLWITTSKEDNLKIIENPLQFISPTYLNHDKMVTLDTDSTIKYYEIPNELVFNVQTNIPQTRKTKETTVKQVKPIKIRKTNGFYHLTSNGRLTPIQSPEKDLNKITLMTNVANVKSSMKKVASSTQGLVSQQIKVVKPIAEIAPHIKINENKPTERKITMKQGMFVLNPEEINKRSLQKNIQYEQPQTFQQHTMPFNTKDEISLDIEKFLATSVICGHPSDEVFVISDDENEASPNHCPLRESCKNVWIVCKNIENIGWIAGKKNIENCISFEFPGFKSSIFYPEDEALNKISQILARKVYVPKHIEIKFQVVESEAEIESIPKLEASFLFPQYILTKKGFRHKFDVMTSLEALNEVEDPRPSELTETLDEESFKQKTKIMSELEEASRTLEDEGLFLWDKTISRKNEILESFSETSEELRYELTEQLNCIIDNTEN